MNHPETHDLTALAYGMVGGEERDKLLEHVHLCDECRALYDSYLEEQALMRDSLFRDARSGPAEARALERTLQALSGTPEPVARDPWRVFHLVTWQFVGKAAAVIVVALGLMVVLLRPDREEPIHIAQNMQAQARVVSGSLMVPSGGNWRPASDVPAQDWVMSSGTDTLVLELAQGSQFTAEPGTVFRFVSGQGPELPSICVLHGTGEVRASEEAFGVPLWSGEGEFLPLARSVVRYSAEFKAAEAWRNNAYAVRAYERPNSVRLRLSSGRGVFLPASNEELAGVVDIGQSFYCSPDRKLVSVDGSAYSLGWQIAAVTDTTQQRLFLEKHLEKRKETLALLVSAQREAAAADALLKAKLEREIRKFDVERRVSFELSGVDGVRGQTMQIVTQDVRFSPFVIDELAQRGTFNLRNDEGTVQLWVARVDEVRQSLIAEVSWPQAPNAVPQDYQAVGLEDLARRLPPDARSLLYEPVPAAADTRTTMSPARGQSGPSPRRR